MSSAKPTRCWNRCRYRNPQCFRSDRERLNIAPGANPGNTIHPQCFRSDRERLNIAPGANPGNTIHPQCFRSDRERLNIAPGANPGNTIHPHLRQLRRSDGFHGCRKRFSVTPPEFQLHISPDPGFAPGAVIRCPLRNFGEHKPNSIPIPIPTPTPIFTQYVARVPLRALRGKNVRESNFCLTVCGNAARVRGAPVPCKNQAREACGFSQGLRPHG
jgi:hypothetical protein